MYRSVYADIEGLTFRGLDSLNSAIRGSLEKFNAARMASREYSRRELSSGQKPTICVLFLPYAIR